MSEETNGNNLSEIGQKKAEKIMTPEPDNVLKISLDTNQQVERLQAQLEEKSAKIAVMEYEKNHNSFGAPIAPKGGDTAPLNPPSDDFRLSKDNRSLMTKEYSNEFELYSDLAKRSAEGDVEAQAIERQLLKNLRQNCGGLLDVSFYGDTHALYRQPKPITPNMTKEQIEYTKKASAALMAEKAKWKRTEGV